MNKLFSKLKLESIKNKRLYLFLLIVFIIGVIFGSLFITILDEQDKSDVLNQIATFFNQIKTNKIDYLGVLKNSIISNILYITLIWFLGISIIGIPLIIIMLFLKGFMISFSLVAIITKYNIIGVLGALTYIFPHIILSVLIIFMMSYYALKLSFILLNAVIKKKSVNFSEIVNHYGFVLIVSVIFMIIASLIETFISPFVIKLFLFFV